MKKIKIQSIIVAAFFIQTIYLSATEADEIGKNTKISEELHRKKMDDIRAKRERRKENVSSELNHLDLILKKARDFKNEAVQKADTLLDDIVAKEEKIEDLIKNIKEKNVKLSEADLHNLHKLLDMLQFGSDSVSNLSELISNLSNH